MYMKSKYAVRSDTESKMLYLYDMHSGNLHKFTLAKTQILPNSKPLRVYFDPTYRCNLYCSHCITDSGIYNGIRNELSLSEIKKLFNEFREMGVFEVAIGGGEPLIRSDIFEIIQIASALGINVILTTNGTLIKDQIAKELAKAGVFRVKVSIDGDSEHHDKIRGNGVYIKAIAGLRNAKKYIEHVGIRVTVVNETVQDIPKIVSLAEKLGCSEVKIALVKPFGRASLNPDFIVSREKLKDLLIVINELNKETNVKILFSKEDARQNSHAFIDDRLRGNEEFEYCALGRENCYINPQGKVFPCVTLPNLIAGDLRKFSFEEIWENSLTFKTLRREFMCTKTLYCEKYGITTLPFIKEN